VPDRQRGDQAHRAKLSLGTLPEALDTGLAADPFPVARSYHPSRCANYTTMAQQAKRPRRERPTLNPTMDLNACRRAARDSRSAHHGKFFIVVGRCSDWTPFGNPAARPGARPKPSFGELPWASFKRFEILTLFNYRDKTAGIKIAVKFLPLLSTSANFFVRRPTLRCRFARVFLCLYRNRCF